MTEFEIEKGKETFTSIFLNKIGNRPGSKELLEWLNTTDFFTAPASTKYHEAYPGGLCEHSLVVYRMLSRLNALAPEQERLSDESVAVCALLHDVCKCNVYVKSTRNVKNETTGVWEKVPFYLFSDSLPMGHGEKSVFLITQYMTLSLLEAVSIRWHMGAFDDSVKGGSYALGNAYEKFPAALNLHIADMQATYQKGWLK